MNKPIILTKVSLRYSSVEDRMRMTGRISEDEVRVFWLTQRISHKLVKAMSDFIEKASPLPPGSDRELMLSFQQSAAMVRNEPSDPVTADSNAPSSLVDRIDISQHKDKISLNFFIPAGGSAQLSLSIQNARQWLGILHAQYQHAAWSLDSWPVWMSGAMDNPEVGRALRNVH